MNLHSLQSAAQARRSVYALNKNLPVANDTVIGIVEHAIQYTPSAFNSQSTRAIVLLGTEHDTLWQLTLEALRAIVPANRFDATANKINAFKAAAGTVLFFEDQDIISGLQNRFPSYADNFPSWADRADAMAQYAIWTSFITENIGANLQHYNPIIDEAVATTWNVPESWKLRAQLVFGGIEQPAAEKQSPTDADVDVRARMRVYGA